MSDKVNEIQDSLDTKIPWSQLENPATVYEILTNNRSAFGPNNALSFQIAAKPGSKAESLTWSQLHYKVTQTANLFRSLGVQSNDVVAFLLPNSNETVFTLLGGMVAGVVNPLNPLLSVDQIAGILRTSNAKVLVTLKSFPKTNIAQLASAAVEKAPNIQEVLEIDLLKYLSPPKSWIAGLVRPKNPIPYKQPVRDFNKAIDSQPGDKLTFDDSQDDRIIALFHTGGTTGIPKLVQHQQSGVIYNGWCGKGIGIKPGDVVFCPLPLFHVFAAYPIMMSVITVGAHVVFPTPAGYRGENVFDLFWKLIEQWKVSYMVTVPTALAALMQRNIDADVSSLKTALCGSAPLPVELFNRFEKATGVTILEGYGLTEMTCLVSVNPMDGEKKIGSVGKPFPYTNVRILHCDVSGNIQNECETEEIGEICISSPGVYTGKTYTNPEKNIGLYADDQWLRTGDLGKLDGDGYLWITGRSKDLIIRGGHNVDPAIIEETLAKHQQVAFTGAIGQPDHHLGEVPCVYVELTEDANVTAEELTEFANQMIDNKIARPVYLEILESLPKTAVGKVFKPDLRKKAITRVFEKRLSGAGISANIVVNEDPDQGLVASVNSIDGDRYEETIKELLDEYPVKWKFGK